jgi:hypothetical protein
MRAANCNPDSQRCRRGYFMRVTCIKAYAVTHAKARTGLQVIDGGQHVDRNLSEQLQSSVSNLESAGPERRAL